MSGILSAFAGNAYGSTRTRRTSGRRALAALDVALGDASTMVTPDARLALLGRTRDDEQSLRMLLATVSFLAETEHAPCIDLALVERAASLQPQSAITVPARGSRSNGIVFGVVCMAALGVALLATILYPSHRAAYRVADVAVPHLHSVALSTPPTIASAAAQSPVAPKQAEIAANALPAWQPADPPAVLHLRFYMADLASPPRARFIAQRLEGAGFVVDATPDFTNWPPHKASVRYFYEQDRAIAARVAAAADVSPARTKLSPTAGLRSLRAPGTVELYLP